MTTIASEGDDRHPQHGPCDPAFTPPDRSKQGSPQVAGTTRRLTPLPDTPRHTGPIGPIGPSRASGGRLWLVRRHQRRPCRWRRGERRTAGRRQLELPAARRGRACLSTSHPQAVRDPAVRRRPVTTRLSRRFRRPEVRHRPRTRHGRPQLSTQFPQVIHRLWWTARWTARRAPPGLRGFPNRGQRVLCPQVPGPRPPGPRAQSLRYRCSGTGAQEPSLGAALRDRYSGSADPAGICISGTAAVCEAAASGRSSSSVSGCVGGPERTT